MALTYSLHDSLPKARNTQLFFTLFPFLLNQRSIIFNTLVDHWMRKFNYPQPIAKLTRPLVAASIEVLRCWSHPSYAQEGWLVLLVSDLSRT